MIQKGHVVLLRDGTHDIVLEVDTTSMYPVKISNMRTCTIKGTYTLGTESPNDIVEILGFPYDGMEIKLNKVDVVYYNKQFHIFEKWNPKGKIKFEEVS